MRSGSQHAVSSGHTLEKGADAKPGRQMIYSLGYSKGEFGGDEETRRRGDGDENTNHHIQKKVSTSDASANGEVKPGIKEFHLPVKKKQQ